MRFVSNFGFDVFTRLEDISKKLTEDWKVRHFESSEAAFKKHKEGFVRDTGPSFFQKAEAEADETKEEPAFAFPKIF